MEKPKRGDIREDGAIFWSRGWWVPKAKFDELTEHVRRKMQEYSEANKAALAEKAKARYQQNKERVKAKAQEYYWKNRETILPKVRAYEKAHAAESLRRHREYRAANPEIVKARMDAYKHRRNVLNKMRREESPLFVACNTNRQRVWRYLWFGAPEGSATHRMIGCTPQEFRDHLQAKFRDGMNWSNYGGLWEIDHIIPLVSAKTVQEVERLGHYTNLQPLLISENVAKGVRIPGVR